ncbi:hypothetical protein KYN89_07610 [Alteriqipengyuania sp. NZ-12B]|uniref:Lipoprotein n=1 Tax=Alteriqipengyuania abyssalis TaxID=2860200 RepID=A0ABS7PCW4_9SPHN|nr:hypothetical protein [Alteriqipengyuania abyssalis]MBY8336913.1 hypothetical protein [Alteriqipengyuania abyssalis]
MRKLTIPALLAGTLLLGGCAYGPGYGYNDGYGPGGGYNDGYGSGYGDGYGYSYRQNSEFERAAVNACGREASRTGRVEITYAEERDRGVYTVQGRIAVRDRSRDQFTCQFSASGRIIDFRFG